jgi:hypothetical protein
MQHLAQISQPCCNAAATLFLTPLDKFGVLQQLLKQCI